MSQICFEIHLKTTFIFVYLENSAALSIQINPNSFLPFPMWSLPVVVPQLSVTGNQVDPLTHAVTTTLSLKSKHMYILHTKEKRTKMTVICCLSILLRMRSKLSVPFKKTTKTH